MNRKPSGTPGESKYFEKQECVKEPSIDYLLQKYLV